MLWAEECPNGHEHNISPDEGITHENNWPFNEAVAHPSDWAALGIKTEVA
jgi:hypothetical protein